MKMNVVFSFLILQNRQNSKAKLYFKTAMSKRTTIIIIIKTIIIIIVIIIMIIIITNNHS